MTVHNADIADAFEEIGELLSILGENAFRIRAYLRAAQVVRSLPQELATLGGTEDYDRLPGIGKDLAGKIATLVRTGRLPLLERLRRQVPAGVRGLLALPGMGPVRVRALMTGLHLKDRDDLRHALADGRLARLRGFGPVLRSKLAQALATPSAAQPVGRLLISTAAQYASPLQRHLAAAPGVMRVDVAGSFRRGRETVGDLDLLVVARPGSEPLATLARYPELREITVSGSTRAAGILHNGLPFDVRVVSSRSAGAALQYFTGSKAHGIHLRRRAQERGLKLSEYGLFRGRQRIAGATEEGVYAALGLAWIPPELREDRGEIEAAERHALPALVERADLTGDLHVHSSASDGHGSIEAMVDGAQARNLRYIAITDHAKYLGVMNGLDAARLARQGEAIDVLNERRRDFTVLKGVEVDILEDGRLALPDSVLRRLDVVIIALHSHFALPEAQQTKRVLRALERPYVSILAHPTGRLIGERPPVALDFARVLEAVRQRGCFLEVNAQPARLDLDEVHIRAAVDGGVRLSIASDAHSADQFANLDGGVRQARRGWARSTDVLNARPLEEVRRLLRRARA